VLTDLSDYPRIAHRLLTDLADAERYQDAYNSLSEEVNSLLARNQLAEEEAERLGKFNAEILGHNNPAQRISYVDRIRRELADAKYVSPLPSSLRVYLLIDTASRKIKTREPSC
jgi:hypothetical protein